MNPSEKPTDVVLSTADTKPSRVQTRSRVNKSSARPVRRNAKPGQRAKQVLRPRRGSKTAKVLALLKRSGGASLQQLQKATGWQAHSVRGFLSGTLKKNMGLRIDSANGDDGERTYRLSTK